MVKGTDPLPLPHFPLHCWDMRRALSQNPPTLPPTQVWATHGEQVQELGQASEDLVPGREVEDAPKHSAIRVNNVLMQHLKIPKFRRAIRGEQDRTRGNEDRRFRLAFLLPQAPAWLVTSLSLTCLY